MNNKNKFTELLNSKGFYTALFTCLFAVLAIAAFISIKNIDAITKLDTVRPEADPTYGEQDVSAVNSQPDAISVRTVSPSEASASKAGNKPPAEAPSKEKDTSTDAAENASKTTTKVEPKEKGKPAEQQQEANKADKDEVKPKDPAKETDADNSAAEEKKPEPNKAEEESAAATRQKPEAPGTSEPAPDASKPSAFAEGDTMNWPLDGAIVMDFSMDHTIYDKTLDQYRTNPSISIGAEIGTQVKATADGVVKSITIDPRTGYTVVIDHGGGWETKYGQLQETVLVQENQEVTAGQAIGGVGNPTKYGVLLGSHLDFGIIKDSVPQDPQLVLAK